ncbi:MAG: hypothetical protein RLZZ450_2207, partial [Pseudomonadota bacterium]
MDRAGPEGALSEAAKAPAARRLFA